MMGIKNDIDIKSFEDATAHAKELTEHNGGLYIPLDKGEYTWPQYSVMKVPSVGDEVSYGFNGDYYPDGKIAKVSKTLKVITTTTGGRYYRRRQTGSWVKNKTWSLIQGYHNERNPHF